MDKTKYLHGTQVAEKDACGETSVQDILRLNDTSLLVLLDILVGVRGADGNSLI